MKKRFWSVTHLSAVRPPRGWRALADLDYSGKSAKRVGGNLTKTVLTTRFQWNNFIKSKTFARLYCKSSQHRWVPACHSVFISFVIQTLCVLWATHQSRFARLLWANHQANHQVNHQAHLGTLVSRSIGKSPVERPADSHSMRTTCY